MKPLGLLFSATALQLGSALLCSGEIRATVGHNDNEHATAAFRLQKIPPPSGADLASRARLTIVDGERDENGGELSKLTDGKLPTQEDEPAENFFFNAGTDGGRLAMDFGREVEVKQVNTYSWHPGTRAPQVYQLYASAGTGDGFSAQPKKGVDPATCGWKLLAKVDTRPPGGEGGGQYGVSVADSDGPLGRFRYLLFDISRTEDTDAFGNTFYSEIDVLGEGGTEAAAVGGAVDTPFVARAADGCCEISIDTAGAPDLKEWAETKLAPVLTEWYPKLSAMLASDGYTAPEKFSVTIRPRRDKDALVASTGGRGITANSDWLKRELTREAIGALLHEEVHVVQQYGSGRRNNPEYSRPPGWLVEGIPDYIRWFQFEPQSHGADIVWLQSRRNVSLRYDAGYRITANFLNYVVEKHDSARELIRRLNAACRQGKYKEDLWQEYTGKTLVDLGAEWKDSVGKELALAGPAAASATTAADPPAAPNSLSEAEKAAGWKLLFNGRDFTGWHNFKREGVRPGWQVKDGALVCVDPHNAGDLVTEDQFGWFELQLEYNISEGGNSGIMFHVTDAGNAAWATGPEFQLEDNAKAADPVRCGWLYALYQPPNDPATGKPLDATKPAGQWNQVRLLISPEKCEHDINGVKYFEYVLGSDDFNARVAKSKFGRMPHFAKSSSGSISLQGDHGQVSFRNIKIRPLPSNN